MGLSGFEMSTFCSLGKWSSSKKFTILGCCTVLFLRMRMVSLSTGVHVDWFEDVAV